MSVNLRSDSANCLRRCHSTRRDRNWPPPSNGPSSGTTLDAASAHDRLPGKTSRPAEWRANGRRFCIRLREQLANYWDQAVGDRTQILLGDVRENLRVRFI